jgi:uncharacterized protein (TIGR03435 family)
MVRTLVVANLMVASWGQSAAPPTFEVASIKQHVFTGGGRLGISISGSRVTVSIRTLNGLIMDAYEVKAYQISGGPSWVGDSATAFDIDARTDGTPTMDQVRVMLQALLADRFQLKFHREMKDLSVYDLVVGKNGPKIKESASDATPSSTSVQRGSTGSTRLIYSNVSMAGLAGGLANYVGRPVNDKTRLSGIYNLTLEWSQEGTPGDAAEGPSIFTAVQEQLGLKLEPSRAAVETLVIDHVAKPTEN